MQLVRELLDGLSIPRYEHTGFEADDVIGTLARRGAEDGLQTLIFTGDGEARVRFYNRTAVSDKSGLAVGSRRGRRSATLTLP